MTTRRQQARDIRNKAAEHAFSRPHPTHANNGEEFLYRSDKTGKDRPSFIANFTKGLPHDKDGFLCDPRHYELFVLGIQSGNPLDFERTPLGPLDFNDENRVEFWKSAMAQQAPGKDKCPGADVRAWESAGAGHTFDLEGPDAQAVTMPPAPRLDSDELIGEMAEVYLMALLRDVPFALLREEGLTNLLKSFVTKAEENVKVKDEETIVAASEAIAAARAGAAEEEKAKGTPQALDKAEVARNAEREAIEKTEKAIDAANEALEAATTAKTSVGEAETAALRAKKELQGVKELFKDDKLFGNNEKVINAVATLRSLKWFDETVRPSLDIPARLRHRKVQRKNLFRGIAPGDNVGPYLSQFLLLGNKGINGKDDAHKVQDGYITYGSIRIDQRVRTATPKKDYMTTFYQWLDVQNGANLRGLETYEMGEQSYRFMATPRDLATYVHYDALYEAYLNACLLLLAIEAPFDPGIPFQAADNIDKQQGFAQFGGPHILSLVTEVATRALKAVRYQKFNVHRRARPEAIGSLVHQYKTKDEAVKSRLKCLDHLMTGTTEMNDDERVGLEEVQFGNESLLNKIAEHNGNQNNKHHNSEPDARDPSYLLPMAFPEGSPMHPAYGAGHAAVAGACVTILKAYFDHGFNLSKAFEGVWEPAPDGSTLIRVADPEPVLTVEGELNKVASNIAIGRDWAGVHYFTDYIESLRLGEQIALGLLEEQKLTFSENFTMTVPLFEGNVVRI